jgi:hypothetical protein
MNQLAWLCLRFPRFYPDELRADEQHGLPAQQGIGKLPTDRTKALHSIGANPTVCSRNHGFLPMDNTAWGRDQHLDPSGCVRGFWCTIQTWNTT